MSPTGAVSLASTTSFRIGGTASQFHAPTSVEELASLVEALGDRDPFFLGGGCNTLFPDGDLGRPVVSTTALRGLELRGSIVRAEAGVRLDVLIRRTTSVGLGGLEGLVGIPGTVGGATVMNAGGVGGCFGDHVSAVGVASLDGSGTAVLEGRQIPWRYRSWGLEGLVVLWVELRLEPCDRVGLRQRSRELFLKKSRTQPLALASAGCVFKNPPGGSAGRIIEELGLKGARCGGAVVSSRHANFIVNETGSATARDVLDLIDLIRGRVESARGTHLETEIVLVRGGHTS